MVLVTFTVTVAGHGLVSGEIADLGFLHYRLLEKTIDL